MTTIETMLEVTNDMKYLQRLDKGDFWFLLFPQSNKPYVDRKWELFERDKVGFIWSCSADKVQILVKYINDCKTGAL
tara:strand:- start:1257 stop:1487 length:231 start_codon:yes stop_codon:yes gene_type:complete